MPLNITQKQLIANALATRANPDCRNCGKRVSFDLYEDLAFMPKLIIKQRQVEISKEEGFAAVMVICPNCSHVTIFAAAPLGILPQIAATADA